MTQALPAQPNIDWLKKTARQRLAELRVSDPAAKLHRAQLTVAKDYGFKSWRALKAHVDNIAASLREHTQVFDAARAGDVEAVRRPSAQASIRPRGMWTVAQFTRLPRSDDTRRSSYSPAISRKGITVRTTRCGRFAP